MIRNERLLIFILAVIQFTHIVDFMIMMPLGKQFMELYDISPQQFSLLVSSYAFSAFVAGLVSALFVDRFDRRHALLVLYTGFTIGTLVCAMANSYHIFLAAREVGQLIHYGSSLFVSKEMNKFMNKFSAYIVVKPGKANVPTHEMKRLVSFYCL